MMIMFVLAMLGVVVMVVVVKGRPKYGDVLNVQAKRNLIRVFRVVLVCLLYQ